MRDDETVKVLTIHYEELDFLVNRDQCSTSVYASDLLAVKSRHLYLKEVLMIQEGMVLFFDLDQFLRDIFHVTPRGNALLGVISELTRFGSGTRKMMEKGIFAQIKSPRLLRDVVACRIASATEMAEVPIGEIKTHPRAVGVRLEKFGIWGVRFLPENRMQYLIDLDLFLGTGLLFAKGEGQ